LLIILGGPISVNDADIFPFLDIEINLLKQRVAADKPTLGICLGAQLIASALGAKVYSGNEKEIGWYGLKLTTEGKQSALRYLSAEHCSMLHWHGETLKNVLNIFEKIQIFSSRLETFRTQNLDLSMEVHNNKYDIDGMLECEDISCEIFYHEEHLKLGQRVMDFIKNFKIYKLEVFSYPAGLLKKSSKEN